MLDNISLMDYKEYLSNAKEEEIIFIKDLYEQGQLIEDENLKKGQTYIKDLKEIVNVLVITATRCKDSATVMPFLLKLTELNKKVKVNFLLREENRELLEKLSGELKVPAIMILNNEGQVLRKYIEFPKGLKEILISNSKEKTQEIIDDMRLGKYNKFIQEDLIKLLTGEEYEYISFERGDK